MGCFHSTCPTKVFTYDDRQDSLRGCGVGGKDPAGIFQHRLVLVGDNVWFLCFYIFFSGSSKGFELFRLLGSLCKFSSDVDVKKARCSSQQAFTECQPIVVCSVLLQAFSGNRRRFGY